MKKIALSTIHESLGAKMVPFAGYNMPVQYEGVNIEHETVRTGIGVFDVSHMGEFLIEGENALALTQKVTSNDASKLDIGDAQYSCLPNETGGIVDDLICYKIKDDTYLLVVNASNIDKDWIGVYDSSMNGIMYDEKFYKSLGGFSEKHYSIDRPDRVKSANGWKECECEVNGEWISTYNL
jgi:aminomethyltransferase